MLTRFPLKLKLAVLTALLVSILFISLPVWMSHSLTVLSDEPLAMRLPSGENATE